MNYHVFKRTMTYADTLEAVGLADLIAELTGSLVRLKDQGELLSLEFDKLPEPENWLPPEPGYPFIYLKTDGAVPIGWVLDYEKEREKAVQLQNFRRATGKKRKEITQAFQEQGLQEPPSPSPEYRIATFLASMRKGWASDKQLYLWLKNNPEKTRKWVAGKLTGSAPSTIKGMPKISNSQVFNPISGKGVHRPKPDSTSPASISGEVIDPFAEWMKFRGAFQVMLPFGGGVNYKVLVAEPADISLDGLVSLADMMRKQNLWGIGIRLDIEALLRLTELLIMHSDVMGKSIILRQRRPSEILRGLHQAYFQKMGPAHALMNYSFTSLPSWFAINNRDDANAYLEIIQDFIGIKEVDGVTGCLRSLSEDRSGDIPVLQQFRKWLMTGELKDLLEFCYRFALHQVERLGRKEWVKALSTDTLSVLFERGYNMKEIINSEGFQSVARAIRNATIYALYFQRQGQRSHEVHFGLAQKWKQKIKGGNAEFISALCEFVQQYNWESENLDKVAAGSGSNVKRHHKVRVSELDEIISFINDKGAELIGMLLLAYGYARTPKQDALEQEIEYETEEVS